MMLSLLRKVPLDDSQFLMNLGDWPLSSKRSDFIPIPMFSWCGSDDTHDIVLPTYELTESVLNMQGRVSLDVLSVFGKQTIPFESKVKKIFWRGRDSNKQRLLLVHMSKQNPELIDAALTNFFFFRDEADLEKYGPRVPHTSFYEFFKHKYLINLDGTVAAYRLPNLLAGTSLLLKQSSKYYEHFYHLLRENEHFIPVNEDLSNLYQIIQLLGIESDKENDSNSRSIGIQSDRENDSNSQLPIYEQLKVIQNARTLVLDYLLPTDIYCYYFKVFSEYSNRILRDEGGKLKEKIEVLPQEDELVTKSEVCNCNMKKAEIKEEL